MRRYIAPLIGWALPAVALAAPPVVGYFQSAPGFGGASKQMCVKNLPNKRFEVYISAGVCPSEGCLNYRPAAMTIEGALKSNAIYYSDSAGCKVKVTFGNRGATVSQNDSCHGDDNPYFYANGYYNFIKPEASESDCGP
jgi:hypothetical protein